MVLQIDNLIPDVCSNIDAKTRKFWMGCRCSGGFFFFLLMTVLLIAMVFLSFCKISCREKQWRHLFKNFQSSG